MIIFIAYVAVLVVAVVLFLVSLRLRRRFEDKLRISVRVAKIEAESARQLKEMDHPSYFGEKKNVFSRRYRDRPAGQAQL